MKLKLLFIAAILVLINLVWLPYRTQQRFEKEYKLLDHSCLTNRIFVDDAAAILHCLPNIDLVRQKITAGQEVWKCYDRTSLKLLWSKKLEVEEGIKVDGNRILLIETKKLLLGDQKMAYNPMENELHQDTFLLDNSNGNKQYLSYTLREGDDIFSFDFSNCLSAAQKVHLTISNGYSYREEYERKQANHILPYQKEIKVWSEMIDNWSWRHFFDKEHEIIYLTLSSLYGLKTHSLEYIDFPTYSMVICKLEGLPLKLDVAIFDKTRPNKLLYHSVLTGKNITRSRDYENIEQDNNEEEQQAAQKESTIVKTADEVVGSDWSFSVNADTIFLKKSSFSSLRKIVLPTDGGEVVDLLSEQDNWLIYIKKKGVFCQYSVPKVQVPVTQIYQ